MKRFLLSALAVIALFFAGRWVMHALASNETKIRWRLEAMADGFNRTRTDACLAGLALDFRDETYGADREDVRQGLAYLFFQKKDPETKGFPYRVELPRESMRIVVHASDPPTAEAVFVARFFEKHAAKEDVAWETRITSQLALLDGSWFVQKTEHAILAGKLPR